MARSATRPMPLVWWLRPVSRHARVGEHSAVVWKLASADPAGGQPVDRGRLDVGPVAAELGEADVVEHDEHHVRGARRAGAGSGGHHGVESRQSRPMTPAKPAVPCPDVTGPL